MTNGDRGLSMMETIVHGENMCMLFCTGGGEFIGIAGLMPDAMKFHVGAWFFYVHDAEDGHVLKYRIRKPKGLTILQDILREVERTDEMV